MISDLIYELVQIPGPSGFESRVANRLKELLEGHVDEIRTDKIGNLIARKKGTEGKHSLALVAHMDQVSMVVLKVDEFVWFDKVGWIDFRTLPGTPVLILGQERDVPGVVCSPSAHFAKSGEPQLWIDVGDRQKFVTPGDPIVYATQPRWLDDKKTLLSTCSVDDRIGCSVLVEVAKRLNKTPKHDIYFVGSVQEEIGSFGVRHFLRQITPDWLIALDTDFAEDAIPDINKHAPLRNALGVCRFAMAQPRGSLYPAVVNFSSPFLVKKLTDTAKKLVIPFNISADTSSFSDDCIAYEANPEVNSVFMFMARRYSHSPNEVVDLNTAKRAVNVLCEAITDSDKWE
ncbi:M42 family metallopeptidase [Chloroflexota bacterium]